MDDIKKEAVEPTVKENLDTRKSRVDLMIRINEGKDNITKYLQESRKREVEIEKIELDNSLAQAKLDLLADENRDTTSIFLLMAAARAISVGDCAPGMEPTVKGLWNEDELDQIKGMLMDKLGNL